MGEVHFRHLIIEFPFGYPLDNRHLKSCSRFLIVSILRSYLSRGETFTEMKSAHIEQKVGESYFAPRIRYPLHPCLASLPTGRVLSPKAMSI